MVRDNDVQHAAVNAATPRTPPHAARSAILANTNLLSTIVTGNIYGLYNSRNKHKLGMLSDIASERNASVLLLTETHLIEEVRDVEIQINGFDHLLKLFCIAIILIF